MNKKIVAVVSAAAFTAVAAITAFAQTATVAPTAVSVPASQSQPMILQVGAAGKVLLRGTVASVSAGSLTVTSWGGAWTVNVGSGAEVLPVAAGNDLAQFKVGDYVGVQGTVSRSAIWTVDATLVRDWTYRQAVNQERQQNVQSIHATIKNGTPRNYVGVASNISGSSLTLTEADGTSYTVDVALGAEVVNRNYITLPFSGIRNNDNVRVWGVNASGTITAQIVRDVSIPATPAAH
ncbi:MAG: hypothetical protein KGJ13_10795 [Patescibacteria group bacterium]|nr:hypothetical protein [Patescibacteria group bacterium]